MRTRIRTHVRLLAALALAAALTAAPAAAAWAGSPHFVDSTVTATQDGVTLTVTGKEAGLGDEAQVHVVVTATASCINPGDNKPQAANKQAVMAEGDFPVQHGSAEFELVLTAAFQPPCSPPMSVVFSNIVVTDTTSGISIGL